MSGAEARVKGSTRVRGGGLGVGPVVLFAAAVVAAALVLGLAWGPQDHRPAAVGAVAPKSVFIVDGEPEDDLLDNDIVVHTAPQATITGEVRMPNELWVRSTVPSNDWRGSWSLRIQTPQDRPIGVGTFEHGQASGIPGESVMAVFTGGSWTCAGSTGVFRVDAIEPDADGTVTKLALSIEHHCHGSFPAIYGEIRIDSAVPVSAIDIDDQDVRFGVLPLGGPAHDEVVTITNVGDSAQDLAARVTGIDADAFSIAGDTCSDADLAPGAACALTIRFLPVRAGAASAVVEVTDDTVPGLHTIRLVGSTQ